MLCIVVGRDLKRKEEGYDVEKEDTAGEMKGRKKQGT